MHTISTRQARALSIVAPGTVAIRDDSTPSLLRVLVSTDDRIRSGIVMLDIDAIGNVRYHLTDCRKFFEPFSEIVMRHRAAEEERVAEPAGI